MKFQVALLSLLVAPAQAFTPTPLVPQALINNGASPSTASSSSDKLWRPPMNMVAGGAEQGSGSDYYEGAFLLRKHGNVFTQTFACLTYLSFHIFSLLPISTQVLVLDPHRIFLLFCFTTELFTLVCLWFQL